MNHHEAKFNGLTEQEVTASRDRFGRNKSDEKKKNGLLKQLIDLFKEPMFLLLLAASTIYFITGKFDDGVFMVVAIILVSAISLYQESRSRVALEELRKLTQPFSKVIRGGHEVLISSEEIVVDDLMIVEEGTSVPADGVVLQSNDFMVNESLLTGESFAVTKNETDNQVYQGTAVVAGLAVCKVIAVGNNTRLGKIGKSMELIGEEKTPLQIQINNFARMMAVVGGIVFLIVWAINFSDSKNILDSLLKSLTLAMSILPEEIPVAFTTFMALGAWRLMKLGIIVKQTKTVETLGSATVICTDKTGTITENKMSLARLYAHASKKNVAPNDALTNDEQQLITMAMWSSEPIPFDPMERALHQAYEKYVATDERPYFKLIHEYPLEGRPPMMTHIFQDDNGRRIIAAKGAPEAIINVSAISESEKQEILRAVEIFSADGFRVLGVATAQFDGEQFHAKQQHFTFNFVGLIGFYDPPKKNIQAVFDSFHRAGIKVKILTGDNELTTKAIAKQVGLTGIERAITGEQLMKLSDAEVEASVQANQLFTRMFPEAKLRIINALKARGEIVAMTGDGVNDGPALKAAHIGIAMGSQGSEIARQASSLILTEDNLANMVDAVAMGRKIYTNLKKAIQYIISIHIPIILTVFIPLLLGWVYPAIFSPIHIIFLELIMGPTCSIIYENEPIEKNLMEQKPRPFTTTFFNLKELATSIIQGLVITLGTLIIYQYAVGQGLSEHATRTMVFVVLVSANVFLTLINRSFYYSILTTLQYKNRLVPLIIGITLLLVLLILFVNPLTTFFEFETISNVNLTLAILCGFVSVIWFEAVKWMKRHSVFFKPD